MTVLKFPIVQCPCPNQPGPMLSSSRARLLGAGAPSRSVTLCVTRPSPRTGKTVRVKISPRNSEADDGENLSLRLGNCDYYRCSPDCKGHQIVLRSVSIGKWFNIISFLIANWTTVLIYLDNLSAFRQNVCDGMIWWHIFVEKVNENVVNQSFFARDVYIIRGPKIRSRGK